VTKDKGALFPYLSASAPACTGAFEVVCGGEERSIFSLNFFIGTVFLAILFHYILLLSLEESFLFAVISSLLYTFAHASWKRPDERRGEFQFLKSSIIGYVLFF